jgi:phospholipid/cholesterol/gamma-HCH transport system permease protein
LGIGELLGRSPTLPPARCHPAYSAVRGFHELSDSTLAVARQPEKLPGPFSRWISQWGSAVVDGIMAIGDMSLFAWQMLRWMVTRLPCRGTVLINFYQVGALSLPVVALTGTFIGMVLAVQSYAQFHAIGLDSRLGAVINSTLVKELGPVLAATMLAGRVGSAMAAVLGTMRVTEQIDALTTMGADPIHYLVVPRFLACIMLIPMLTIMADFMGIVGGYFYSVIILDIDHAAYLIHSRDGVTGFDLFSGVFKSFFFGGIIALVSCYRGFHCQPGAEGVGKAATTAFVYSFVLILAVDLFLTIVLNSIYYSMYPNGASFL